MIGYLIPLGLIVAGIMLKLSKKEELQNLKKRWLVFVIIGFLLFTFKFI